MRKFTRIFQTVFICMTMLATVTLSPLGMKVTNVLESAAASVDYPAQLMNIAVKDNSKVLTESGTADGSAVTAAALGNDLSPSWRFDRVGSDSNGTFFKLCNAESGRLLTPYNYNVTAGAKVIMYGSESAKSQHWYVIPVSTDHLGNDLYYKIVNYEDTSLALTQGSSGMTLETYTGADSQLWLLNCDGLQGFAGYCSDDDPNASGSTIKAADIGGLFGEIVEVSSFDDLKKYATSDTPYTILVTKDISVTNLTMDSSGNHYYCPDGRITVKSNKTIIGSYSAHTLYNVQFLTEQSTSGGSNIIIKNFDLQHSDRSNGNDSIVVYFRGGQNLWVDHCTFTGHSGYNNYGYDESPDWDKFLACCYYADYCTVSECSFGLHEYGIILGYPDSSASNYSKYNGYPRMTLAANKFDKTLTRAPGLMRWGYYHSLNNYVNNFSMAYTVQANCNIFAENCYYANGGNVCCDWNQAGSSDQNLGYFLDSGSATDGTAKRLYAGDGTSSNPSYAETGTWKATSNYTYVKKNASEVASYTTSYSGCQTSKDNWMYLRFGSKGIPSAGYTEAPNGLIAASFDDGTAFMIQNVNSSLFLEVKDGNAANGENIQQWGASGTGSNGEGEWNVWRLYSAGDDYYYIYSALGDGKTYVLDVSGKKADNGTNIDLYQYNGGDNQKFKFVQNSDGSYKIYTKVSEDASVIEIENGSFDYGANVQQWAMNGFNCQDWNLIPAVLPINGVLVRDLAVNDTDNANSWSIAYNTAEGDTVFGDRTFTITSMPEKLTGAERILTACDSKSYEGDLGTFTAGADEIVYIAMDTRVSSLPAWLSSYTDTGMQITLSNDVVFHLYSKEFAAGDTVTLGTNGQSSGAIGYSVFVTEAEQAVTADVNSDGEFDVADLVALSKYLLGDPSGVKDWTAGDLNSDGRLNIYDLVLMRELLVNKL